MFSKAGLALMLLDSATVGGRDLPAGAVGTEEDFGEDLHRLLREGLLAPFDPREGLPPVPNGLREGAYAYLD